MQFNAPINSLSLGNVSLNFVRELIKKGDLTAFFPQKNNCDLAAFDLLEESVKIGISEAYEGRFKRFDQDEPTLKVWHIDGSEESFGANRYLYTFYETDEPTLEEINLVKNNKATIFSSSEARDLFASTGLDNVHYVPLGFDQDIIKVQPKKNDDVIHFGLVGKLEKRKNTQRIIRLWLDKFGNNPKYQLTCLVNNPFFQKDIYRQVISQTVGDKHWNNINFLNTLKTNSEVNLLTRSIDIDLSGLSSGEGWNLPSFNATAVGNWSVVSNCSAHKDWATEDNAILVDVEKEKRDCYDNVFFHKGSSFNQGKFYSISDESIISGIEEAVKRAKTENKNGLKLQKDFTYSDSIDKIKQIIKGQ
jgi:hypothetical protein